MFFTVFVQPILNLLVALYKLFLTLGVPGAFGLAIVALTAGVRLILHPFFKQQMHTAKKMQELKPHLDELNKKHKEDPKMLQQEQLRLYQEAGVNPAAGCLFAIVQIPIFIGLYNTLTTLLTHGVGEKVVNEINSKLYTPLIKISTIDPMFLGLNLALSPQNAKMWYYYAIPLITAILQYFQALTTMPAPPKAVEKKLEEMEGKDDKKQSTTEDFQKAMNTQMKYLFPIMIGYFSYTLPVGMSLYWNIFSIFSIIQHYQMQKKAEAIEEKLEKIEKKEHKKHKKNKK